MEGGGSCETFEPISAIKNQSIYKVWHTTEEKGSRSYNLFNSAQVNIKSLSDGDSYDEEENISGNGDEERYFFSSDSDNIFFWQLNEQFIIMLCSIKRF